MMSEIRWRIDMLGALQAQNEQRTLHRLSMRRIGALLACLTLRSPQPVPREEIVELLWPEEPPDITRNRLRVLLNSLRKQFEPEGTLEGTKGSVLEVNRVGVRLLPGAFVSDYHVFLDTLQEAKKAAAPMDKIAFLERAVALYRGELLTGFYDEWILAERRRLAEAHFQALRDLARHYRQMNAPERAVEYARRAVAAEPLDEEAHCNLIDLYGDLGQPSAGLRQYAQWKRLLWEEMRAEPSAKARARAERLTALLGQVGQEGHGGQGLRERKRVLRPVLLRSPEREAGAKDRNRLPPRLTRFFGRTEEIGSLCTLLAPSGSTRLVSLLGPGGMGKTRLALETAERLEGDYAGRIHFVALAETGEPAQAAQTIAKAMRLPPAPGGDTLAQVVAALNQAPSLLVLDNMEHLLPDARVLVERLLFDAPSLRCLITSRRSAGIEGEHEMALAPLPSPKKGVVGEALSKFPGVALFVDRARAVRSDFALTPGNADDVVQLCRILEGLPLAIELAAARARVLTPREMRNQTGKLLDWLVDTKKGKGARHQSLRAALEWSYRLLAPTEARFFNALSVFVGGFSAEAAGYVGLGDGAALWEALELLERLTAASLLTAEATADGVTRFGMLETVREFGVERLTQSGAEAETRRRHFLYFAALPKGQKDAAEAGNLHQALEFGLRPEADAEGARGALRLASGLSEYWERQGRWREGLAYLRRANLSPVAAQMPQIRVAILRGAGVLAGLQGDYAEAQTLSEEGLALAETVGEPSGIAGCLCNLGNIAFYRDDYVTAQTKLEQALRLFREVKEEKSAASCLIALGNVAFFQGDHTAAEERIEEALGLYRRMDDSHGIASALLKRGNVWRNQSDFARGRRSIEDALTIYREMDNRQGIAACLHDLGLIALFLGESVSDYDEARTQFDAALTAFEEIGYQRGVISSLTNLGGIAREQGRSNDALPFYREAMALCQKIGDRRNIASCLYNLGDLALNQGEIAEARTHFRESLEIEREIGNRGGIANGEFGLGRLALSENNLTEARRRLSAALEIYHEMRVWAGVAITLEEFVALAQREGHSAHAARLAGAAAALRENLGYFRVRDSRRWEENLVGVRAALGESAFAAAWEAGGKLSLSEALLGLL